MKRRLLTLSCEICAVDLANGTALYGLYPSTDIVLSTIKKLRNKQCAQQKVCVSPFPAGGVTASGRLIYSTPRVSYQIPKKYTHNYPPTGGTLRLVSIYSQ